MIKKRLFIYIMPFFLFTGCSINNNNTNNNIDTSLNNKPDKTITNSLSSDLPTPSTLSSLGTENISPTKYLSKGNLLFLPNSQDNNFLKIINNNITSGLIPSDSPIDTFQYSIESLTSVGNTIYFSNISDNNFLYKLNYIEKSTTKLFDIPISKVSSYDNALYFINTKTNYLTTFDLNTNKLSALTTDKCGDYIIAGEYILYQNIDDNLTLYVIKSDGTSRTKLTKDSVDSFTVYNRNNILYINSRDNNLYSYNTLLKQSKLIYQLHGTNLKSYNTNYFFIDLANSNHLSSIEINESLSKFSTTELTTDMISEYFPTSMGICYKKNIDTNNDFLLEYK